MVNTSLILKKEVGLFIENNIDNYRLEEKGLNFQKMLKTFLDNEFVVITSEDRTVKGYLDVSDANKIKTLIDNKVPLSTDFSELDLELNQEMFRSKTPVKVVLESLKKNKQQYLPILTQDRKLIGRVSIKIIKNKINKLYSELGIEFY